MTTGTACELCGVQTTMLGTKRCDRCWELEKRIRADPEIALKVIADMKMAHEKAEEKVDIG